MAENAEETTPAADDAQAPPRRRASRRVTAAAGTVAAPAETDAAPTSSDAAESATTEPAAEAPKKRATRSRKKPAESEAAPTDIASSATENATSAAADAGAAEAPAEAAEAPKKRATRSRKKATEEAAAPAESSPAGQADAAATPVSDTAAAESAAAESSATASSEKSDAAPTRRRSTRKTAAQAAKESAEHTPADSGESTQTETASARTETKTEDGAEASSTAEVTDSASTAQEQGEAAPQRGRGRRTRGKAADANGEASDDSADNAADESSSDDASSRGRGRGRGNGRGQDASKQDSSKSENGDNDRGGRGDANRGDQQSRSSRTRQRDRKRRGQGDDFEHEITDDDVLLPIAGILDVLDNYAFVRTSGYLPGPSDVYVSLGQVKKYGLRKGDAVVGAIRQPRENDGGGRQKYNAIVKVDTVNSRTTEETQSRSAFDELTPLYPQELLQLETSADSVATRIIDLVAPIGKGQRGFIIGERGTGKSSILRAIAESVSVHAPDAHLMAVVLDERPEEVTELQRTIKGEVVASTFDQSAEEHTTVAELSIERAKRLVELGHDVVVLLDSITVLGRSYAQRPIQGRAANTAVDATALQPVKGLLAAARNIENGGSLTIIATALEKTGSRTDKVILRELAGTANSEVRLSRELADEQLASAIDVTASRTVRAERLRPESEARALQKLRAGFATKDSKDALTDLLAQLSSSTTNAALLAQVMRG